MERHLRKKLPNGRFLDVSPVRSRTMGAIRSKNTKSTELVLRMLLVRGKITGWRLHPSGLIGNPDLYFPHHGLVVFVDGCFWHGCPHCGHIPKTRTSFWRAKITRNGERDRRIVRGLRKQGLVVMRIWEHSLANPQNARRVLERIRNTTSGLEQEK